MREILFRGFTDTSVQPQKWIYGNYNYSKFDGHDISHNITEIGGPTYEIIPETRGQYIGAKDKHGVMIFEGDNIKTNGMSNFEGEVVFHECSYKCKVVNTYSEPDYCQFIGKLNYDDGRVKFDYEIQLEVTGSIHDNI